MDHPTPRHVDRDRIVVVGGSARAIDLLRLATIRSDDVVLVGPVSEALRKFARQFAIEVRPRAALSAAVAEATAVLVAIGDAEAENGVVRTARRLGVPVHVADRELVSDFKLLEFLEHRPIPSIAA